MLADFFINFFLTLIEYNLIFLKQVSSFCIIDTISGPNSLTRQFTVFQAFPVTPLCSDDLFYSVAATTAFPAGNTQWIALKFLHAYSVFGPIPPFPTITFTPVCSTNSFSNFSIRILVVGPTETISNLSFSKGRMIGPAWKIALFLTSTGSGLCSSTRRRELRHGKLLSYHLSK